MKNKGFRIFCIAYFVLPLLQVFAPHTAWASDFKNWQKGMIEGAFQFNPYIQSHNVSVEVHDQLVVLKGVVDSETSKALAEQLALSVKGVHRVVNRLVVDANRWAYAEDEPYSTGQYRLSNVTITNKVRSQLLANKVTNRMEIDVETHNRVVTLSGIVESDVEKALTYWLVKNTHGVKTVVDKLDVITDAPYQSIVQISERVFVEK